MKWSISHGLVVATVAVYLILRGLDALRLIPWEISVTCLGLSRYGTWERGWVFELGTFAFVHFSATHLCFNMLSLWMLGPDIERVLGVRRFVAMTLTSLACSAASFLVFAGRGTVIAGGFSGIIFGILVAQARFFPHQLISLLGFFPIRMRYAVFLMGAVELYLTVAPEGGRFAHAAHLFAAVGAWVFLGCSAGRHVESRKLGALVDASRGNQRKRSRVTIPKEL